ncbi:MAG: DNA translocase FtsK 4TM domain-containing protein, partial [Gemmatimonadaceae bacterium]|nr:DNA translocase FtsK 4TM domain-containing protein [Gemmatimonadaceae bacterium]
MSRSTGTGKSPGSEAKAPDSKLRNELKGIGLALFAVFLAGALVAQSLSDVRGSFGWVGENLAQPLANFFGWPAAALLPIAPAAHALRLFGRMDEKTDRKWMVFLLGLVVLLPIALSHAAGGDWQTNPLSGIWGSFAAFYLRQFAGNTGTWIILLLALSALMASTLSWNPIRVVLGKRITTATPVTTGDSSSASAVATATMLEPPPEEMPALDLSLMPEGVEDVDEVGAAKPEKKKREKKSRAEVTADISDRVAAAINLTANTGDLLSD